MFGEYNSTKIIEEESLCSSHDQSYGNKIKPDNKNKFGSVEINPNKVKILTEDKSSSYKRDQQKTSSQNKKSDNNDEIPSSSL